MDDLQEDGVDDEVDRLEGDLVASEAEVSVVEEQDEGGSFLLLHIFLLCLSLLRQHSLHLTF